MAKPLPEVYATVTVSLMFPVKAQPVTVKVFSSVAPRAGEVALVVHKGVETVMLVIPSPVPFCSAN
ncbi:MAG: hypothetical protein J4224_05105 [Candidatus Diapherotrites archaeon]|uniref:Uncharacterized protein n=1 Tax=Candidatus Iainarchaeum sp. TaxID=3101447 RepID=A0A8T4L4K1_9ARCH|nr:hypothetical protein [Candidatus Diapherotrites archaeon]